MSAGAELPLGSFLEAVSAALARSDERLSRRIGGMLSSVSAGGVAADPKTTPALLELPHALSAPGAHPLARRHLASLAGHLPWTDGKFPMPGPFAERYAYVEIVGPTGVLAHDGFRFGLYLQCSNSFYPSHCHAAEELYFVLSGIAQWRRGDGPFAAQDVGSAIRHRPWEPHAMQTADEPLLAIWAWVGDIRTEAYKIDAASPQGGV
jgi:mannose-6-phosphate isomerase-like protein (cupin superfamily)